MAVTRGDSTSCSSEKDVLASWRRPGITSSLFSSTMLEAQLDAICFALRCTRVCLLDMRRESSLSTFMIDESMCV